MGKTVSLASFLAVLASLLGCAGDGGTRLSPLQTALLQGQLEISPVIFHRDLMTEARSMSIPDFDIFLNETGVRVHGEGENRFVHGRDLVEVCGPDCNPSEGLGELIAKFAVRSRNNDN